jgi:FAD/FMN-containing dehydrogenase
MTRPNATSASVTRINTFDSSSPRFILFGFARKLRNPGGAAVEYDREVSRFDRRTFLVRSGGAIAAASGSLSLIGKAWGAVDPRLASLARMVKGPVITPASGAYEAARLVYNERFDGVRPLGIFQPASIADIRQVVVWADRTRVPLAVRSGGHSYAGYSTTTGLVVDMRQFGAIHLDKAAGTVTIGGGTRLIDVESTLARQQLAIPTGSCATVGIGGLAQGGGVGFASRAYGTTSDNVVALGIVTADGRYRTVNAKQNPDLFWACRGGGGGNFGIVTHFVFRVHPGPDVSYFFADWDWTQATEVVQAWQRFAPHAPDGLFSICNLKTGVTGPRLQVFGQFLGSQSKLDAVLKPLTQATGATPTLGSSSYLDAQMRWAGCLGKTVDQCHLVGETPGGTLQRSAFVGKSDYFDKVLSSAGVRMITTWIERAQSDGLSGSLLLDSLGGAINRVPAAATAFVHRGSLNSGQYFAGWADPSKAAPTLQWSRDFYSAMRPYVSGFAYQNYIDHDLAGWAHAYYGTNYERLQHVKKQVDPEGLFRFAQGIKAA